MVAAAISMGAFVSCSHDDDYYDPDLATKRTQANFRAMLKDGFDPQHTWETVKNVEVNIPVDYGTGGTFKVVYYANDKIVGKTTVNDGDVLKGKVSVPSYTTELSVSLSTNDGMGTIIKIPADGNTAQNAPRKAATRAYQALEAVEYTNANKYERVYPATGESDWGWASWGKYVNGGLVAPCAWPHKFYYVPNAITGEVNPFSEEFIEDIKEIVPEDKLPESTRKIIVNDYGLTVAEDGPVSFNFVYGISSNHDAIGYFFYTDEELKNLQNMDISIDNLLNLLAENTYGNNPIQYGQWGQKKGSIEENPTVSSSNLKSCNKYVIIDDMQNMKNDNGTKIQLTYYDEDGTPSEIFPKGTKIGFFIVPNAYGDHSKGSIDTRAAVYSFSKMNVEPHQAKNIESYYYASGWDESNYATSHVATFKMDDKIIVGFEDAPNYSSESFDYNDFVFTVDGNFEPIPEIDDDDDDDDDDVQVFTYCFEDMDYEGSDYDFNDCVLKVTPPVNNKITVTLVALGATYRLRAGLGDKYIFGEKAIDTEGKELHRVLGVADTVMVNTGNGTATADVQTIEIEVPDEWNIYENGNFWVEVESRKITVQIPEFTNEFKPGDVPYAIRIAGDFDYPAEWQRITEKYPGFEKWAEDATQAIDWYK